MNDWHRRLTALLYCVLALIFPLLAAGCSNAQADPSTPYAAAGLNASTMPSVPGQAVSYGIPVAVHSGQITLESATVIPLPGYPFPQVAGTGLIRTKNWVSSAQGWPPVDHPKSSDPSYAETLPVKPLAGTVVSPSRPVAIYYALRGTKIGVTYYAAGIKLAYRDGSGGHTVTLYQVGGDCVSRAAIRLCHISGAADKAIEALAGQ